MIPKAAFPIYMSRRTCAVDGIDSCGSSPESQVFSNGSTKEVGKQDRIEAFL